MLSENFLLSSIKLLPRLSRQKITRAITKLSMPASTISAFVDLKIAESDSYGWNAQSQNGTETAPNSKDAKKCAKSFSTDAILTVPWL